jgi:hypothetical protein
MNKMPICRYSVDGRILTHRRNKDPVFELEIAEFE